MLNSAEQENFKCLRVWKYQDIQHFSGSEKTRVEHGFIFITLGSDLSLHCFQFQFCTCFKQYTIANSEQKPVFLVSSCLIPGAGLVGLSSSSHKQKYRKISQGFI